MLDGEEFLGEQVLDGVDSIVNPANGLSKRSAAAWGGWGGRGGHGHGWGK
jgi:hypothetical protein